MRAKRPMYSGGYEYGGDDSRNVSVVQKLVKVVEVQNPIKHA